MEFLLFFLALGLIFWGLRQLKAHSSSELNRFFLPTLIYKLLASLAVGLLYKYHYQTGDTLWFYDQASGLSNFFFNQPNLYLRDLLVSEIVGDVVEPRSVFFTKMLSFINLFAFDNYWILSLFLALINFTVTWLFINRVLGLYHPGKWILLISFFYFPSVAFWSSGIMKETVTLSLMYLMIWALLPAIKESRYRVLDFMIGIVAVLCLLELKYYHAALLLLVLIPLLLRSWAINKLRSRPLVILAMGVAFLITLVMVSFLHYNIAYSRVMNVLVQNYYAIKEISGPGKSIEFYHLTPHFYSILFHSPAALFGGLFRPFLWESWNLLSFLLSLERLILLIFFLNVLFHIKTALNKFNFEVFMMTVFVVIFAVLMAFASPNFGTLSRYSVAYLPFFVFLLLGGAPLPKRFVDLMNRSNFA